MSDKKTYNLCKDNAMCCDDNCQACAQRIYERYMEEKQLKKHKKIKCHVMTMYDWLKKNYSEDVYKNGSAMYCPWLTKYGLVGVSDDDCDEENSCEECWNRPFRGVNNGQG